MAKLNTTIAFVLIKLFQIVEIESSLNGETPSEVVINATVTLITPPNIQQKIQLPLKGFWKDTHNISIFFPDGYFLEEGIWLKKLEVYRNISRVDLIFTQLTGGRWIDARILTVGTRKDKGNQYIKLNNSIALRITGEAIEELRKYI